MKHGGIRKTRGRVARERGNGKKVDGEAVKIQNELL
mgnify:CR=1 FL=1